MGQTARVKGLIHDGRNQPVAFSTVMLLNAADSSLAKAEFSDETGAYAFAAVRAGAYLVSVTRVGYSQGYSTGITLTEMVNQLREVQVIARKPLLEIKPDKTVLNVEGSRTAAGSSALELLQKAPGVMVDPNSNVTLQGKNGVRIYIDGKLSPLTQGDLAAYLQTLQASDIEAIEIITQPSARYDAAGNAGILNIRLEKNKNYGTNRNLTLGLARGVYYPKQNGSLTLNHRRTRGVNLFATYSNPYARDWSFVNFYRRQLGMYYDQSSETTTLSQSNTVK